MQAVFDLMTKPLGQVLKEAGLVNEGQIPFSLCSYTLLIEIIILCRSIKVRQKARGKRLIFIISD